MSDQHHEALSEALFGRGTFRRSNAPEPGLLFELATFLPDDLLIEALLTVCPERPGEARPALPAGSRLRDRVIASLAERISTAATVLIPPGQRDRVLAELAGGFVDERRTWMLQQAALLSAEWRAIAYSHLARDAEPGEREQLLAIAEEAAATAPAAQQVRLDIAIRRNSAVVDATIDIAWETLKAGEAAARILRPLPSERQRRELVPLLTGIAKQINQPPEIENYAYEPESAPMRASVDDDVGLAAEDVDYAGLPGTTIRPRSSRRWLGWFRSSNQLKRPAGAMIDLSVTVSAVPERIVNTGFADRDNPAKLRSPSIPLKRSTDYWFCVEIGAPLANTIELELTQLPVEYLPTEATLTVALFGFPGELELDPRSDVAEFQLDSSGHVTVKNPGRLIPPNVVDLLERRLFFPVRTPTKAGSHRLRCNIYCQGVLVQSRLITARVMRTPRIRDNAVRAKLEYSLTRSISATDLAALEPHKLSLVLNGNDQTHQLRVFADDGQTRLKSDPTFDAVTLTNLLDQSRAALRHVSWGDDDEWNKTKPFAYQSGQPIDPKRLRRDLARLAITGYRIYTAISGNLRTDETRQQFEQHMAAPGYVQFALPNGRNLVPLALAYDYAPFDDTAPLDDYELCQTFLEALQGPQPLEELTCLNGNCPSRGSDTHVCPSGFWGYRHYLGFPPNARDSTPTGIGSGNRSMVFSAASDLTQTVEHQAALQPLVATLENATTRKLLFNQLGTAAPDLLYLYVHGGLQQTIPFILVGAGDDGPITPAYLYGRINWTNARPLVFVNGCHTTAVQPDQAFELVTAFIKEANAAGVIGTEITIGESLARAFAETFVDRLFNRNETVGQAVRNTRLDLLKHGNPLGLVYTPFALANLPLRKTEP